MTGTYCIEENLRDVDERYLHCLEVCFPGAWDARHYQWYLKRPFAGRYPDILTVVVDNDIVAGIGMNYRQLALPDGRLVDVAILTAAWTLPEHRGRWHFARLIKQSASLARRNGCAALLSFVTGDNASSAVLRRCGAYAVPTWYLLSPKRSASPRAENSPQNDRCVNLSVATNEYSDAIRFHYPTYDEWRAQVLNRPQPTSTIQVGDGFAVVEHVGSTDRLQYVSEPNAHVQIFAELAHHASLGKRTLFHFTSNEEVSREATRNGFEVRAGYLMILDPFGDNSVSSPRLSGLLSRKWTIQAGDRL